MSIYLDASFLIPTLVEEQGSAGVIAYLVAAERELLVSEFAAAEVASALYRLVRMRLLASADAEARLAGFRGLAGGGEFARGPPAGGCPACVMLRTPDALHLAIAARLDASIVTLDRRLERAAQELGIAVEVPQTK